MYINIYIYIYRERERERFFNTFTGPYQYATREITHDNVKRHEKQDACAVI